MIFEAMHGLQQAGVHGFDPVIVAEELERRGQLEQAGGVDALIDILNTVPHAAHAKYYGEIVREKFVLRRLILACNDILKDCYSAGDESDDLLARAEQSIFQILEQQEASTQIEMKEILLETFDRIRYRMENAGSVSGITTGFVDLDKQTNGMQPTELIIIAARPSMGKTALVCNIAEAVASEAGKGHSFSAWSNPSSNWRNVSCASARRSSCTSSAKGNSTKPNASNCSTWPANSVSSRSTSTTHPPAQCRKSAPSPAASSEEQARTGSHHRRLSPIAGTGRQTCPREQQIAGITRRLKFLAKELQVPVIALAQLNRGVELREDKRPKLADLRESGAIEQDADIVMFLHRPEMYNPEDRPGEAEIVVAKHRSGPTGIVPLTFNKASMRFENFSPLAEPTGGYFSTGLAGDNAGF